SPPSAGCRPLPASPTRRSSDLIAGSIWAERAWGRYWGWDPTETWAFITWVVYAAYLHARATRGWKGRNASIVALVGYGCFIFNRSEEHTSELQSRFDLVCRLLH